MRRLMRRVVFGEKANYYDQQHKVAEDKHAVEHRKAA